MRQLVLLHRPSPSLPPTSKCFSVQARGRHGTISFKTCVPSQKKKNREKKLNSVSGKRGEKLNSVSEKREKKHSNRFHAFDQTNTQILTIMFDFLCNNLVVNKRIWNKPMHFSKFVLVWCMHPQSRSSVDGYFRHVSVIFYITKMLYYFLDAWLSVDGIIICMQFFVRV